ncbi:MAG TPA: putative ABC exporter domain-containing protein, partial [Longimicrobiales bacterium]|nr:putative ABC exporter domain-containing protein [Longimicrobiales bacterium]
MNRHFAWFIARTLRNKLVRQARRLRSPRYAIAALVGLLYFFFIFGGWTVDREMSGAWIDVGRTAGPLLIALFASWWWLWGGHRSGLILTPAETHLLLPAPLTRAQLIRFKIMQAQPAIVLSALLGTLLTRGAGLPWPLRLLSLWLLIATLHQHQIAASLVHAAAEEHGRRGLRRNFVPVVIFGIGFSVLMWSLFGAVMDVRAAGFSHAAGRLTALLEEPGPKIVLAPFRILLAPAVATTLGDWLVSFAAAFAVLAVHYVWVVRMDAAFEETAAAEGERRQELTAAMRAGGISQLKLAQRKRTATLASPWLPLHPLGRNAYAIFWKNILYAQRAVRSIRFLIAAVVVITVVVSMNSGSAGEDVVQFVGIVLLAVAGMLSLFGPIAVRNDLRMDLKHIDLLRTYPLRSRDLAAAEIAASTLTLTVPQVVLVAGGCILLAAAGVFNLPSAAILVAAAVLLLPLINALALLIQNLLALLYPSWVRLGGDDSGGMEAVGQNMII